jgi:polyhydroxybutyrate depolymerase
VAVAGPVASAQGAVAGASVASSATRSAGCSGHSGAPGTGGRVELRSGVASAAGSSGGSYLIATPRRLDDAHPARLVLIFYGFASNPTQFASLTNLPRRGAAAGDIVVVPHTQSGESEWQFDGHGTDAAYVSGLISDLEQMYCINPKEIFATGFSAGAAFSIIYACAHQSQIAAIATVAVDFQLGCTKPLPILAFHGTADPEVPYQNGAIGLSLPGVKVRGTQLNMGDWAKLDHCAATARSARLGSQVREQRWTGCTKGTSVTLFSVAGGGHTWPGADPHQGVGLTTEQVNATSQILGFFASDGARP